jgi:hypothetical protein
VGKASILLARAAFVAGQREDTAHTPLKLTDPDIVLRLLACLWLCATAGLAAAQPPPTAWRGFLRDAESNPLTGATVELRAVAGRPELTSLTDSRGAFLFPRLPAGEYSIAVQWQGRGFVCGTKLEIRAGEQLEAWLELSPVPGQLVLHRQALVGTSGEREVPGQQGAAATEALASGGERLSSREVSGLPLNRRDFSQLLLLAAGTMTDTNGAANFTQQFAVNGQRGTTTVFAMDGIETTDPELGGATFANFNVDAIQEVRSSSGVLPAEIGHGAAGFTEVITKSGAAQIHGSAFEFLRNAAFDARNFFDRRSFVSPGRLPPFVRNEFGFTVGGPVALPWRRSGPVVPPGRRGPSRTFFFGQYQGFRQVLGTTQVIAVPTLAERQGIDSSAFPGDTLQVPISPQIAPVLARYPRPNDPQGPYGARTYATSSKVSTVTDQFSVRLDHNPSDKARLFARFNLNQVSGPLTNPNQTVIDPSFAIRFYDHQRNAGFTYTRALTPNFTSASSLGFVRSTPFFPAINLTQPAIKFGDALYEPFNSAAGSQMGSYGNLFQLRQNLSYVRGTHTFKMGFEARFNRDITIFGTAPNGEYSFGGGTAYAPVEIPSASGTHDIHVGDPLPDALTGFLTATPYSYTASVAGPGFARGAHIGESAIRREAYNAYFQDSWKITPRLMLNYGLRYEVNTRIREAKHRTSVSRIIGRDGQPARSWDEGVWQKFLFYPQPPYRMDWRGWGPRAALEWRVADRTLLRLGGAITTLLPNLWQDNALTGGIPFVFNPYLTASPGAPVPFENAVTQFILPPVVTPEGFPVFMTGSTMDVPANTEIDLQRFQEDLAAMTPGNQIQPLLVYVMSSDFRNGYVGSYTVGLEQDVGDVRFSAAYVATVGVKIPGVRFPNAYGGADPAFAPFTRFDAAGRVTGGFGPQFLMTSPSHSTFHSLQASVAKNSLRAGLGFQASYTFSKSLDDSSAVLGGFFSGGGTILQAWPQDPRNPGAEKGPSTFDIAHVLAFSVIQALPLERIPGLRALGRLASGWQILNISTLASGAPFSVYSGVQQTGAGAGNADRPDQIDQPTLSTSRTIREDYFGRGADNASFFFIPIGVPGGTGPNQGRFGTLGRNTFRGPAFRNFDVALIKDTPFGRRGSAEAFTLQFRAEFFNVFNLVNFGLPANIVRGSGFGLISRTAGPSRQIQFSLKLIF